jgi:hypothetical protein
VGLNPKSHASEIGQFLRRPHLYYLLSIGWVLFIAIQWRNWLGAMSVDWMLLTGFAALMIALAFANTGEKRLEEMLDRLERRGVLKLAGTDKKMIKHGLEERAARFGKVAAPVLALIMVGAFVPQMRTKWLLCLFEAAWAFVAGRRVGKMIAYGSMGWYLRDQNVEIRPVPGHIDGAAGLRPVGDFCLFQAMVSATPAIYLALWSFAIPAFPAMRVRYPYWMHPFLWLLALAIVVEVLVFVLPMWRFHLDMAEVKKVLLADADRLSDEIAAIGIRLGESKTREERDALNQELSIKTKQFWNIESMPTWPMDIVILRHFALRNAALLLPLIAEATGVHEAWVKLLEKAVSESH